jgi:hypothetical protein
MYTPLILQYLFILGGEGGIRTLDAGLPHTPLAGERFQPLSHLSERGIVSFSHRLSNNI